MTNPEDDQYQADSFHPMPTIPKQHETRQATAADEVAERRLTIAQAQDEKGVEVV
ncbi:hypothetical protein FHU28_000379 [Micromonospora echinospora]|uniref:Uncharacterized protein n=1 Tax=Micromonospora echinospora TaxID=1877 RepID=A0ABR6M7D0_MICEC|nr:hypothetical protein [Micromonospora echinospora]MBB5110540.1 hypothetical protein [Micromonospora echinospora]